MTNPTNPMDPFSPFLPTTYNIPQDDDLKSFLNDSFCRISDVVNDKKIGPYTQTVENQNGEKWFYINTKTTRNGYQTIAYIPSYTNPLVLTLTSDPQFPIQNIDPQFVITQLYGTASKPCSKVGAGDGDYFSFTNEGNSKISFTMSDTQIVITTTVNLTAYKGFIVIHYLRNGV
jgi:hypothetical protein